jgi:hypothetical protein
MLFTVLLWSIQATVAWAAPPTLSASQRQRLEAGDIVVLDTLPPGTSKSALGGTAVATVCAPVSAVWAILIDWPNHTTIYPRITRAEVTHADPSRVRVHYTLGIGPFSFDIYMDKYPDAAHHRVRWRLAEDQPSRFFSENSGYWQVDEAGAESLVTYAVGTRTIVPDFLTRGSHRDSLISTVENLRKRAMTSPCPDRAR